MIEVHRSERGLVDFSQAVSGHSADELLTYKTLPERTLKLAIYQPPGYEPERNEYPLIVFVHGGGWQERKIFSDQAEWSGDYLGFLARYFADRGFLCVSVDYRLMRNLGQAPGYELIDLCDDCQDAVSYLKKNAQSLGIDLTKAAVIGESAGGYLAAALTTLPWMDKSFFKAAIIVNGITDLTDPQWATRLCSASAHLRLKGLCAAQQQTLLSPSYHITAQTCPTLLLHGTADVSVRFFHSQKYHDLMQACGGQVRFEVLEDVSHAFLLVEYMTASGKSLDAACVGIDCINRWLASVL